MTVTVTAAERGDPPPISDQRYRATVDRLLQGQAYRELAAARLFEAGQALAPEARLRQLVSAHAEEERAHYRAVIAVWARFAGASPATMEARAALRLAQSPLPVVDSWLALAMARFLFDRAGTWQLREYTTCSFAPYRALVAGILNEERDHQDGGAQTVLALCAADRGGAEKDGAFACWLAVALLSFGRPGSDGDRYAVAAGLKRRPAAAVMQDFVDDLKPTMRAAGLAFPALGTLGVVVPLELDCTLA